MTHITTQILQVDEFKAEREFIASVLELLDQGGIHQAKRFLVIRHAELLALGTQRLEAYNPEAERPRG